MATLPVASLSHFVLFNPSGQIMAGSNHERPFINAAAPGVGARRRTLPDHSGIAFRRTLQPFSRAGANDLDVSLADQYGNDRNPSDRGFAGILGEIIGAMKACGVIDESGFAAREEWWRATRLHHYADPLRRLFDGFEKHVKNAADVIVSYQDGYQLGSPFLSTFARLRATHGNLLRGESEGFAISTRQNLESEVRGFELNRLFALDRRVRADIHYSGNGHSRLGPALAAALAGAEKKSLENAKHAN